jgi:radical SAM protein with 4Fe4S-binding SPASM domain
VIKKYDFADMEMEIFHRLVPLFPHVEQAALYGHGETFLHKQFFAMLEELKKHEIFVYVTTNGTLITPDVAERLVDLRLDRLSFSLDAGTPELFNDIRLGADFDAVLDSIRLINSIKKRHHRDDQPVLSIMFCAMKSTIQELSKLIRLADQLNMTDGVAVINISEHDEQMQGECLARYPDLATQYLNEANRLATQLAIPLGGIHSGFGNLEIAPVHISFLDRLYRNYREFRRSFNKTALLATKLSRIRQRLFADGHRNGNASTSSVTSPISASTRTIRVKRCRDPWDFLFVDVHGNIRVCCTSHRIMGNLYHDDVLTIWQNAAYQEFRRKMVSADIPEECKTCVARAWHDIPEPEPAP